VRKGAAAFRLKWRNGRFHVVMPTQVGIHVFSFVLAAKARMAGFVGHDEIASGASGNGSVVPPRP
jgi:hypothetical protein